MTEVLCSQVTLLLPVWEAGASPHRGPRGLVVPGVERPGHSFSHQCLAGRSREAGQNPVRRLALLCWGSPASCFSGPHWVGTFGVPPTTGPASRGLWPTPGPCLCAGQEAPSLRVGPQRERAPAQRGLRPGRCGCAPCSGLWGWPALSPRRALLVLARCRGPSAHSSAPSRALPRYGQLARCPRWR